MTPTNQPTNTPPQVLFNVLYIAPFYLSPTLRPSPTLNRDAPAVIRARTRSVTATCLAAAAASFYLVSARGANGGGAALRILGWWPVCGRDVGRTLLLLAVLFAGPLFEAAVVEAGWRAWLRGDGLAFLATWTGFRNLVVVRAPSSPGLGGLPGCYIHTLEARHLQPGHYVQFLH